MNDSTDFLAKYGPWGLVLGASDGVGRAFAEAMAAKGLNVVLVARRQAQLDALASSLQSRFSVDALAIVLNLSEPDAMEKLQQRVEGLDVGFVVNCAGADTGAVHFLDRDQHSDEAMLFRNCTMLMRVCRYFGEKMVARGRGGIVTMGSGAALAGTPGLATYAGTKAFDLLYSEALWGELKPKGVDVLCLMLPDTDTPALRRGMLRHGKISSLDEAPKGATSPEQVAREGIAYIGKGPTRVISRRLRIANRIMGLLGRNAAVGVMTAVTRKMMGEANSPG
jgi:uncharacterized protein